jgi:hypothetical protein
MMVEASPGEPTGIGHPSGLSGDTIHEGFVEIISRFL